MRRCAALMGGAGRVLAVDKDARRLKRLRAAVAGAGAARCVEPRCADFLALDLAGDAGFGGVRGILLDPSCSGSGTAAARLEHLLRPGAAAAAPGPSPGLGSGPAGELQLGSGDRGGPGGGARAQERAGDDKGPPAVGGPAGDAAGAPGGDAARLEALAQFQERALRHALTAPALRRLVYSTCSVHERENEAVIAAVRLPCPPGRCMACLNQEQMLCIIKCGVFRGGQLCTSALPARGDQDQHLPWWTPSKAGQAAGILACQASAAEPGLHRSSPSLSRACAAGAAGG